MRPLGKPPACLFFTAVLASDQLLCDEAVQSLKSLYGEPLITVPSMKFDHSSYYQKEMGHDLLKSFLGFNSPFNPAELAFRKRQTREIEWMFGQKETDGFHRKINIDPGYVNLAQVVLATSKNFSHRVYLEDGVYAEITLLYHADGWEKLPWTYPDYKIPIVQDFLSTCRKHLKKHIDINRNRS